MGAFHAYDIRGIYNVDFDKQTAYKIGYFLPELLKADKVLVGRDCRVSSPEIHDYLIKGITDAGSDVDDIGLSSTPLVYFGTANYGYKASVQITASHNPAEYKINGRHPRNLRIHIKMRKAHRDQILYEIQHEGDAQPWPEAHVFFEIDVVAFVRDLQAVVGVFLLLRFLSENKGFPVFKDQDAVISVVDYQRELSARQF